jgi:hypothetical protein
MFLDHPLLGVALTFLVTAECHYVIPDCVVSTLNSFIPTSNGNQLCNVQAELFSRNLNDSVYWAVNRKSLAISINTGSLTVSINTGSLTVSRNAGPLSVTVSLTYP